MRREPANDPGGTSRIGKASVELFCREGVKVAIGTHNQFTASELWVVGASEMVAYCVSKEALINITRVLAIDCAPYSIRLNCIAPGPIETLMLGDMFNQAEDPDTLRETQMQPILLKRFGQAEEISQIASFLVSDISSYMIDSLVVVNGDATAWYGIYRRPQGSI